MMIFLSVIFSSYLLSEKKRKELEDLENSDTHRHVCVYMKCFSELCELRSIGRVILYCWYSCTRSKVSHSLILFDRDTISKFKQMNYNLKLL